LTVAVVVEAVVEAVVGVEVVEGFVSAGGVLAAGEGSTFGASRLDDPSCCVAVLLVVALVVLLLLRLAVLGLAAFVEAVLTAVVVLAVVLVDVAPVAAAPGMLMTCGVAAAALPLNCT
jgi:hypothetical protein